MPAERTSRPTAGTYLRLRETFSRQPMGSACIECQAAVETLTQKQALATSDEKKSPLEKYSSEIHYFPPRGLAILTLLLDGAKDGPAGKGKKISLSGDTRARLVRSPHPAFAILFGTFRRADRDFTAATQLIERVLSNNKWMNSSRWAGSKVVDVTIYVAWRTEVTIHGDPRERIDEQEYSNRLTHIKSFIDAQNIAYPDSTKSLLTDPLTQTDSRVYFTIVPILEDDKTVPDTPDEDNFLRWGYQQYFDLCSSAFPKSNYPNVTTRRNPVQVSNRRPAPAKHYETHHSLDKNVVKLSHGDMVSFDGAILGLANDTKETSLTSFYSKDAQFYSFETAKKMLTSAAKRANTPSKKAVTGTGRPSVGILLWRQEWQGSAYDPNNARCKECRAQKLENKEGKDKTKFLNNCAIAYREDRTGFAITRKDDLDVLMMAGADARSIGKGKDGKPRRIAATGWWK